MMSCRFAGGYPILEKPAATVFKVEKLWEMAAEVYFEASVTTYESDVIKHKPKILNIIFDFLA
jgi:hypothetical protein